MANKKRSIVKAATWRVISIVTLGILGYIITGDLKSVGLLTILFAIIQSIMYFFHERIWQRIKWGKSEPPSSEEN